MTQYISNFGDQAVVLPLAILVALGLAGSGWGRGCFAWVVAVVGTLGAMLALKFVGAVLLHHAGGHFGGSPSGHVAAACVLYGGLSVLLLQGRLPRVGLALFPAAVVLVIGYTRIRLGAHTMPEVVLGAAVGAAGVVVLAVLAGPRPRVATWPLLAAAASVALTFNGLHINAEHAIHTAARFL